MKKISRLTASNDKQSAWKGFIEQLENEKDYIDTSAYIAFQVMSTMRLLGLKQKDLAQRLDVSPQQVSKILSGQENLTIETINRVKTALGIDIDISNEGLYKFLNPPVIFVDSIDNRDHYFTIKLKHDGKKSVEDHVNEAKVIIQNIFSEGEYFSDDYEGAEEIEETINCN